MTTKLTRYRWVAACALVVCLAPCASALDPHKFLTQYSHQSWGQENGLPQDFIRSITQTADGYLWLGTDEGLARFDGYDFTVFDKAHGQLPANSISALAGSPDGSLWIGTANGLTQHRGKQFRTYTVKDGLPDNSITALYSDHAGTLWIVAGVSLTRYADGKFINYPASRIAPVTSVRALREDPNHNLLVAGFGGAVRLSGETTTTLVDDSKMQGDLVGSVLVDRRGDLWIAGSTGLLHKTAAGFIHKMTERDGLPDLYVRWVLEDHDGNIWVGTNGGFARLDGDRFTPSNGPDPVRVLFEDREGNLWIGASNGLTRLRDDVFSVFGKAEGLPSDEPNAVFQDSKGRIWVGFHEGGLVQFQDESRHYFKAAGVPESEVFSIRESPKGDLLAGTRAGLVRIHDGQVSTFVPPDPLRRPTVLDALEDAEGRVWLASPAGLLKVEGNTVSVVVQGGPLAVNAMVTLCQGKDGEIWAGTNGKGLWRVKGTDVRSFTAGQGLSSDNIRELYLDTDGTLWIGTYGGGLNAYRDGRFIHFTQDDGLLSDNVANIADDGDSLWLSTTRGICRVAKSQLWDFAAGRRKHLDPVNYGIEDGLRSAQCSPGYPIGGGGNKTADGRLWFTTSRGLAVFDPRTPRPAFFPPNVRILGLSTDGSALDLKEPTRLEPDVQRIRVRYTAIHLAAPERVDYSYRLGGLEPDWVHAGARREINYNSLKHGHYQFFVRAALRDGASTEQSYSFEVLPYYYETAWFRISCGALLIGLAWAIYQMRLRQIRFRFALVLGERARLAREIHDTLAQGFVGISSQLDAVAMCMPDEKAPARKYLDLARRMARHSLTEARRSVMDLRASVLEGQDLAAAIQSSTRLWTAGSPVDVSVDVSGPETVLPPETEQHLLRIAQEAVTNVLKHAGARHIVIKLHTEARKVYLRIVDDGRGFEQQDVFASLGGHFGLMGMRERAERLGGEMHLASKPGGGTEVEVTVPLP